MAFTLFTLVMTGVVWSMLTAQRIGQSARNRMYALQQTRAGIESLIGESYNSAVLTVGTFPVTNGGLSGQYVVSENEANDLKLITYSMGYDSFGETASVELETQISDALH